MDATALPLIAALLIAYAGVSARPETTVVTQAMVFVLALRRLVRGPRDRSCRHARECAGCRAPHPHEHASAATARAN